LAFASQIGLLHSPVAESESSHAWKPMWRLLTCQPAVLSTSRIAWFICAERLLDAPRRGRSETISFSAAPGPSYSSGPQVAEATGVALGVAA